MITEQLANKLQEWQVNAPEVYSKALSAALDLAMTRHGLRVDAETEKLYRPFKGAWIELTKDEFRNLLDAELWRLFPEFCRIGEDINAIRFINLEG